MRVRGVPPSVLSAYQIMNSAFLSSLAARDWNPASLFRRMRPSLLTSDSPHISSNESHPLRPIFDHFDQNKDGRINRDELRLSLQTFDIGVDDAELSTMIDDVDRNCDGLLDFSEFLAFYSSFMGDNSGFKADLNASQEEEVALRDAFRVFDKDGDGFICAEELQSVLASMGLAQGRKLVDCQKMILKVDADGDGQVSFDEFKRMMMAGFGNG